MLPAGLAPMVLNFQGAAGGVASGLNSQVPRTSIGDQELWWCDGWFPIAPNCLRAMWGPSASVFTVQGSGTTIEAFYFANIGSTAYGIVFQADGSIWAFNQQTFAVTQLAAPGTISNPTRGTFGIAQWGPTYVLIVAKQPNGYWVWDGTPHVVSTTITAGGTGYTSAPTVTFSAPPSGGVTATGTATISGGVVTGITMTNNGKGYTSGAPTISFSGGGGSGAAATATVGELFATGQTMPSPMGAMPTGLQGTALETYSGRVWVANGPNLTFSAPGSVTDFSTADGGGSFTSSDSFLKAGYVQPRQTNGFLYLIADSSINYISGVTTTGTPPTTSFTNQNANPEIGTPFPDAVDVWGENIVFANTFGIFDSYGSGATKVSDDLDGFYQSAAGSILGQPPSSAKAIVFGKKIYCSLVPIVNPYNGNSEKKLLCWDSKKWFTTDQGVNLLFIQGAEIASDLLAYGTDGTYIYQLFSNPSTSFTKVMQSKFWDTPGNAMIGKVATRFWGVFTYYSGFLDPNITVQIDSENGSQATPLTLTPSATTPEVLPPMAIANQGVLTGITLTTTCSDMSISSLTIGIQPFEYRG